MDPVIEARGLSRNFGALRAVVDLDLTVQAGEIVGLLGPNGSGKTTTLRMLTGRLRPTAGTARVLGCAMPAERRAAYARLAVVGEQKDLFKRLTGRENLHLFAQLRGVGPERVAAVLADFDLTARAAERVAGYSQGMQQRLLLARAFLARPALVFLDEPTRGLDPPGAAALRRRILAAKAEGCAVLLSTHLMAEAEALCDRVAFIARGRLVALDTPAALRASAATGAGAGHLRVLLAGEPEARWALDDAETPERVRAALAAGRVLALSREQPSLEEVFLQLTGEASGAEGLAGAGAAEGGRGQRLEGADA